MRKMKNGTFKYLFLDTSLSEVVLPVSLGEHFNRLSTTFGLKAIWHSSTSESMSS